MTFSNTALVPLALDRLRVERHPLLAEASAICSACSFHVFICNVCYYAPGINLYYRLIESLNLACLFTVVTCSTCVLPAKPLTFNASSSCPMTPTINVLKGSFSYDAFMIFWRIITQIFFREIRPRGAFNIPRDGPVIFVGAPHNNQVRFASFRECFMFNKGLGTVS